jgi:hypothetical protein
MSKIVLTFSNGKANIDAVGFTGGTCIQATEFLKKLGNTTSDYEFKREYYEENINMYGECHADNLCG